MEITKERLKSMWPYTALLLPVAALLIVRLGQVELFALLMLEMIIVFGYIAAIIDLKKKKIPNKLILTMLAAWVLVMTPKLYLDTETAIGLLKDSALGLFFGGGMFLFVYLISRKGLGGGDVKFMAAAGLYLGFAGAIQTILFGTILAALTGLSLILLKKLGRKDTLPLAPFLFAGILAAAFFGG